MIRVGSGPAPDTLARDEWREQAACLGLDPELFHPLGESRIHQPTIRQAKAVCATCPVRRPCLAHALTAEGDAALVGRSGIYGGTTPSERHALARAAAARDGPAAADAT